MLRVRIMVKHRHPGKYRSKTPKGRIVYKRRPIHKLTKDKREIIQRLDKKKFETGGRMDFNKKGLERADVWIGNPNSVDIPVDEDMEISWHTHPGKEKTNQFPSTDDLISLKETPSQYELILSKGKATGIKKLKNYKPDKKMLKLVEKGIIKDSKKMSEDRLFKKYKPKYEKQA